VSVILTWRQHSSGASFMNRLAVPLRSCSHEIATIQSTEMDKEAAAADAKMVEERFKARLSSLSDRASGFGC